MAEWSKAHAWKVCVPLKVPWVRIPLSPPSNYLYIKGFFDLFSLLLMSRRKKQHAGELAWQLVCHQLGEQS